MIDDELTVNRRVVHDLFLYAHRGDASGFLSLHAADALLMHPVLGDLAGSRLTTFLLGQFEALRHFDMEYVVADIGLCSSRVRVTLSAKDENAQSREPMELEDNLIMKSGAVIRHDVDFDIAHWGRVMLPDQQWRRIYPGWRRHLREAARKRLLES